MPTGASQNLPIKRICQIAKGSAACLYNQTWIKDIEYKKCTQYCDQSNGGNSIRKAGFTPENPACPTDQHREDKKCAGSYTDTQHEHDQAQHRSRTFQARGSLHKQDKPQQTKAQPGNFGSGVSTQGVIEK